MNNIAQTTAEILVKNNIVRINFENLFILSSGVQSPIYCDCRELISLPETREIIINFFIEKIKHLSFDGIAGTATAGIPWASFLAQAINKPLLYVRSKAKSHGKTKMVEGKLEKNKKIIVIEDAFSTGKSSCASALALRNELQAEVENIFGIFSWDTPLMKEYAEKHKVNFIALTQFDEIIKAYKKHKKLDKREEQKLINFKENPKDWQRKK